MEAEPAAATTTDEAKPVEATTAMAMQLDPVSIPDEARQEPAAAASAADTAAQASSADTAAAASATNEHSIDNKEAASTAANSSGGRAEWDHSNRRVLVQNVYKHLDNRGMTKNVEKWVESMKEQNTNVAIEVEKVKKPPNSEWAVLTMKEEAMCQPFIEYINQNDITNKKGGKIVAKLAKEQSDDRKRPTENNDNFVPTKRQKLLGETDPPRRHVTEEEIKDKVTPLWKLSEDAQRQTKTKEMIKKCAMKIYSEIKKRCRDLGKDKHRKQQAGLYPWLEGSRSIEVKDIITAPTPLRNKSEFTFGYRYLFNEDEAKDDTTNSTEPQKVPAVGFMVTGWAGGVSRPHCCRNIPPEMCQLVNIVDEFLSSSVLAPYDTKVHQGFWRTMTVRTSRRTKECMIIIMHAPPSGGVGEKDTPADCLERFDKERERLVSVLTAAELPVPNDSPIKVTSIFFQEYDGISHPTPEHPVQHVFGKECLVEQLGKCTFQISPGAFFQVNTEGAEMLYQLAVDKVREVAEKPDSTLLFDVCCGTGTIGLTCLKEGAVGRVVGIDISEPAIIDAKKNAELNGFSTGETGQEKTRFVASKAESVLHKEIGKAKHDNENMKFVALVDPARQGLHADVIRTLRSNGRIDRIVYVSCNPTGSLVNDAALLCQPPSKKYSGRPFRISSASPVDMFPLTDHCEMVMVFDRLSTSEMGTNDKS